jgi:hypothetical protein
VLNSILVVIAYVTVLSTAWCYAFRARRRRPAVIGTLMVLAVAPLLVMVAFVLLQYALLSAM